MRSDLACALPLQQLSRTSQLNTRILGLMPCDECHEARTPHNAWLYIAHDGVHTEGSRVWIAYLCTACVALRALVPLTYCLLTGESWHAADTTHPGA